MERPKYLTGDSKSPVEKLTEAFNDLDYVLIEVKLALSRAGRSTLFNDLEAARAVLAARVEVLEDAEAVANMVEHYEDHEREHYERLEEIEAEREDSQ